MSSNNPDPIVPGSPLARALDGYAVPALSAGFAERVMAAADARPAPLPPLRRSRRGWRVGQRLAIGIGSFGVLASAAAAAGLLAGLDVPSPARVWASIAGSPAAPAAARAPVPATPAAPAPASVPSPQAVEIVGPVDTPEELAEAFRRIDDVRQGRSTARRARIDERIASEIERRRAAGLPVPTAEQEARLRERAEAAQTRLEQAASERLAARRAEMERKVENGEALTREDIMRPLRDDAQPLGRAERIERLRRMTPEQRREALRRLPPAERRALMEQYRARRADNPVDVPLLPPPADDGTTP